MIWFSTPHETGETWEAYAQRMVSHYCQNIKREPTLHAEPMGIFGCNYQPRDGEVVVDAEWTEIKI